jgi:hypothetical protein
MLEDERPCLIAVTLQTRLVVAQTRAQLLALKSSVLIVTIGALHRSFRNLMLEPAREGRFLIGMTGVAEARLSVPQQKFGLLRRVGGVAIDAGYAGAVVFAAAEVEPLFAAPLLPFMALQTYGARFG